MHHEEGDADDDAVHQEAAESLVGALALKKLGRRGKGGGGREGGEGREGREGSVNAWTRAARAVEGEK